MKLLDTIRNLWRREEVPAPPTPAADGVDYLLDQLRVARGIAAKLRRDLADLTQQKQELSSQLDEALRAGVDLQTAYERRCEEIRLKDDALELYERSNEGLEAKCKELSEELREYGLVLKARLDHIEEISAELARERQDGRDLQIKASQATVRIRDLEEDLEGAKKVSVELAEKVCELEAVLDQAQIEIEQLRSENLKLKGGEQLALAGTTGLRETEDEPEADRELISESTHEIGLQVLRLSFRDGNKWHFTCGDEELSATIIDETFVARLHNREIAFADGDIVIADVHVATYRDPKKGIHTEREIVKVKDVQPPPRQLALASFALPLLATVPPFDPAEHNWLLWLAIGFAIVSVLASVVSVIGWFPHYFDRKARDRRERLRREDFRQTTEEVLP